MKTYQINLATFNRRVYHALVWGKLRPQKGKIETFIKRSSKNRQLMEVSLFKEREQSQTINS